MELISVGRRSLSGASAYLITDETATIGNATPRSKGVGEDAFPQQTPRWLLSHPVDFTHEYPSIAIVTTAALPWLTGTAVNPALRAAYLWERGHDVTLLVPWVVESDQEKIFLNAEDRFRSEAEQLVAVKRHIGKRVPFEVRWGDERGDGGGGDGDGDGEDGGHRLHVVFYAGTSLALVGKLLTCGFCVSIHAFSISYFLPSRCTLDQIALGKYSPALGSIIPTQDIQPLVPRSTACIVLEEPEHLTWYHSGRRWIRAFNRYVPVVGVMHTNYVDYARRMAGEAASITLKRLNKFLCRQHTHTCIKLSGAVQRLPREQICFVHGVADGFLNVGRRGTDIEFSKGAYFLGKALWAKGFQELLDRMQEHVICCAEAAETTGNGSSPASAAAPLPSAPQHVDVFGHGHELEEIKASTAARNLPISFHGPKDHLSEEMVAYRVFVNPSTSDVVATTSAEALAMGKWLLVPRHPCNVFFESFRNCLIYESPREFSEMLVHAATNNPHTLTAAEIGMLTWQNATDRFLFCCSDTNLERSKKLGLRRVASRTSWMGYNVGYGVYSVVRKAIDSINLFA